MSISTFVLAAAAFMAGVAAYKAHTTNPFEAGTKAHDEWSAGYREAAFRVYEADND